MVRPRLWFLEHPELRPDLLRIAKRISSRFEGAGGAAARDAAQHALEQRPALGPHMRPVGPAHASHTNRFFVVDDELEGFRVHIAAQQAGKRREHRRTGGVRLDAAGVAPSNKKCISDRPRLIIITIVCRLNGEQIANLQLVEFSGGQISSWRRPRRARFWARAMEHVLAFVQAAINVRSNCISSGTTSVLETSSANAASRLAITAVVLLQECES